MDQLTMAALVQEKAAFYVEMARRFVEFDQTQQGAPVYVAEVLCMANDASVFEAIREQALRFEDVVTFEAKNHSGEVYFEISFQA